MWRQHVCLRCSCACLSTSLHRILRILLGCYDLLHSHYCWTECTSAESTNLFSGPYSCITCTCIVRLVYTYPALVSPWKIGIHGLNCVVLKWTTKDAVPLLGCYDVLRSHYCWTECTSTESTNLFSRPYYCIHVHVRPVYTYPALVSPWKIGIHDLSRIITESASYWKRVITMVQYTDKIWQNTDNSFKGRYPHSK